MVKGKLTSDMKRLINLRKQKDAAIKKALKPIGRQMVADVKALVPQGTGALKRSIKDKEISKKGNAAVIVGPSVTYEYKGKIPNLYANKMNERFHFLTLKNGKHFQDAIAAELRRLI